MMDRLDALNDRFVIDNLRDAAARTRHRRQLARFDRLAFTMLTLIVGMALGAILYTLL